jgi:hypothetical protein
MADLKISALTSVTTPMAGTEQVPVVQSGSTKKATVADFLCGPLAQAYQSSAQTLSSGTYTLIQFQTELYDTNGCFNNTGSSTTLNGLTAPAYSFTPNRAGWYQVSAGLTMGTLASAITISIYKNGVSAKILSLTEPGTTLYGHYGSGLIYLNGTGDYIQIYGRLSVGQALDAASATTYFDVAQVR